MFDKARKGFKTARDAFSSLFASAGVATPTQNEMRLDADEWTVKRKLGKSFFTRQLNSNARAARIAGLTDTEWQLARNRRWI